MKPNRLAPLLLAGLLAACASPKGPAMHRIAEEINTTLDSLAETVVVPGDVLALQTLSLASLEQGDLLLEFNVQPDGKAVLPGLGVVHVAGRTAGQLSELMREALAQDLAAGAKVTVSIASPAAREVHMLGSVRRPGPIPMPSDGHLTLPEAFAAAGGVGYLASYLGNTQIIRWDAENQRQVSWVVDARFKWWGEEQTVLLQPNDVVFVPDTPVAKVNTWLDRYIIRNIPFPRFIIPGA